MNSQIRMNKAKHFQKIGLSTHCLYVSYMKMQHELQNKITKGKILYTIRLVYFKEEDQLNKQLE